MREGVEREVAHGSIGEVHSRAWYRFITLGDRIMLPYIYTHKSGNHFKQAKSKYQS
jgi:hypothetical protein